MTDALQALVDIAQVSCRFGHEVLSAQPDWTLPLGQVDASWVATRYATVVLQRGDRSWLLYPGCAALLRGGIPMSVGTSSTTHPPPEDPDPDFPRVTGVAVGSASFGPLADEALALPEFLETQPHGVSEPTIVEAVQQFSGLPQRWGHGQADALAQVVVTTVLRHGPPPVLAADNSLGAVLDVLFDPTRTPRIDDLLGATRMSERTLRRRCAEATGLTPTALGRWYRSLRIRGDLQRGTEPAAVAARNGYASVAAMRRALANTRPPNGHPPASAR